MVGADLDVMLASRVYWTKMARAAPLTGWPRLHRAAMLSLLLWFLIVFAGTVLTLTA